MSCSNNIDASKRNFENIYNNQIQRDMNVVQAKELETAWHGGGCGKEDTRMLITHLVSVIIHFVIYFICSSYSCITLMLRHKELELSMLLKYLS